MNQPTTPQTTATTRSVVMLSGDLLFASRVKSAAESAGHLFVLSGKLPEDADQDVGWVIVDLSTRSGLIDQIADQVQRQCPAAKLIAYGPHVHVNKLQSARQAGIPTVMTNGQFDAQLATMFTT